MWSPQFNMRSEGGIYLPVQPNFLADPKQKNITNENHYLQDSGNIVDAAKHPCYVLIVSAGS